MNEPSDSFIDDLRSYYAARGKSLSEKVASLLAKDPLFYDAEDMEAYERLILPARGYVKHSLKEMMATDGRRRHEWRGRLSRQPKTLIEVLVNEVLHEEGSSPWREPASPPDRTTEGDDTAITEGSEAAVTGGDDTAITEDTPALTTEGSGAATTEAGGRSRREMVGTAGRKVIRALEWAVTLVLALAILLAAFLMIAPRFGMQAHPVMSGSMEPALKVGGLVLCRKVPVSEVKVGDIIGYNSTYGQMVTHRVIDIVEENGKRWFQTKGDANEDPDPDLISISGEKVDKVIFHVPYLGFFSRFMKTRLSFLVFICAPALILVVLFGRDLMAAVKELREEKRRKESREKAAQKQA